MKPLLLYADFNNADAEGRVRLNGVGTLSDLARLGAQLLDGQPLTIHDEELVADGEAVHSPDEKLWTARIDWSLIRRWNAQPVAASASR